MRHTRLALTALALLAAAVPSSAQDSWLAGPDMSMARQRHAATLLADGRLLITGGAVDFWGEAATSTCEIYDLATETWSSAASMSVERSSHTATLLADGTVLVTGGYRGGGYALRSAELYDPATDQWTTVASMSDRRYRHQAIALTDSTILVVGGRQGNIDGYGSMTIWAPVSTCEIYNVATNTWTTIASMNETRVETGLALLPDGRVLAAGGINDTLIMSDWGQPPSQTCEIYDPVTDSWTLTDSLQSPRNFVRLVTLDNNKVLSVGGEYDQYALYDSELFDVLNATWTPTDSLASPRIVAEVLKLPNGDVMTIGGWNYLWHTQTNTAEYYAAGDGTWWPIASLNTERGWHTATQLGNGDILVAGGTTARSVAQSSTEIYRVNSTRFAIASVGDAPADEGGFVRLVWNRHDGDRRGSMGTVTAYEIWLRDDVDGRELPLFLEGKWRMVGSVDARGLSRYAATVPAIGTSTPGSPLASTYVVVALTGSTPSATAAASGSAYDNRGPAPVQSLRTSVDGTVGLAWTGPASDDVARYEVFAGDTPGFALSERSRVATTTSPELTTSGLPGRYVRVRAVDRSMNPGPATPPVALDGTSAAPESPAASAFSVGPAYPSPAADAAAIPVTAATATSARVEIYDQLSRLVARLDEISLVPGRNTVRLDLGSLAPGSYVCAVTADGAQQTTRLTVVR